MQPPYQLFDHSQHCINGIEEVSGSFTPATMHYHTLPVDRGALGDFKLNEL